MKKFLSILLTLVLLLSLGTTAFAANSNAHVITITNASAATHSYAAYQVFAGDYVDGTLSNIEWGSGVNGAGILTALQADETFGEDDANLFAKCTTAADVAEVLATLTGTDDAAKVEAFADVVGAKLSTTVAGTSTATEAETGYTYAIPVTGDGYYFIKDAADPTYPEGAEFSDTLTDYILQVVGDVNVAAKSGTVTVEKQVATGGYACGNTEEGHVHSIAACGLKYADDNTAQIGDVVSFKLESTVPAEAAAYDYYYFIFGDKLSDGLSFDLATSNMAVTIGDAAATKDVDYTVSTTYGGDAYTFAVALTNAKANAGKTVVVTYEAKVDTDAVIGIGGNTNEVEVKFSKNPNEKYDGGNEGGFPAEGGKTPDGTTPKDKTKTYVTEINLLKVDGENNDKTLAGAVFTISGTTESVVVRTKDVFTPDNTNGTYYKLKGGSYTTDAPVAEHMETQTVRSEGGYVVCQASDPDVKYTINDVSYRVASDAEIADTTVALYKHIASNEGLYVDKVDNAWAKYTKTTETVYECTPETFTAQGTTKADGTLVISGLNAGEYTITEIIAPSGYNLLKESIKVTVGCTLPDEIVDGTETCTWSYTGSDNSSIGTVLSDGTVQITVENNTGATLPETGGIGTTIFYVLGGILLVGAAVLLITKKRMGVER